MLRVRCGAGFRCSAGFILQEDLSAGEQDKSYATGALRRRIPL